MVSLVFLARINFREYVNISNIKNVWETGTITETITPFVVESGDKEKTSSQEKILKKPSFCLL